MRVYIPVTLTMLGALVADQMLHARSGTAFAVTPTLRESYAEGDDDELAEVYPWEDWILARSLVGPIPTNDSERDLFAGVRSSVASESP